MSLLLGALIGWVGSLVMRTQSSEGILVDIVVGAIGAGALAVLLGNRSTFDSLLAGYLGAIGGLALVYGIRRAQSRSNRQG
jgi:uncharacterized membrane protein YeaQ/YmgE (transglycosylase-associated protein family)